MCVRVCVCVCVCVHAHVCVCVSILANFYVFPRQIQGIVSFKEALYFCLLILLRVHLTDDYSLSVIRHDDKAYFLSSEVSEWFWESDLLQSMLRQVHNPCWGLLMTEKKNKKLFQTLRRVHFTSRFVLSRQQVTIYSLEE